jgi:Flp pilus assembly protein TadG
MTTMTLRKLFAWLRDERGAAAVELALVAPFLAVILAGIATYAPELDKVHKMQDAVSTGSLYVMTGGTNATSIQNVALTAWTGHTTGDSITVTQWCACGSVSGTCTSLCADSSVPTGYTSIAAASTYVGPLGSQSLSAVQTVRTR